MYGQFLIYLSQVGYTPATQRLIKGAVREFLSRLNEDASSDQLMAHYDYLCRRPNKRRPGGLSSISLSHHLYALRLFFSFLQSEGYREDHPMSGLCFPPPESYPREVLSPEQIQRLYLACKSKRERAMLAVFYGCGLRRKEVRLLNLRDVRLREKRLYVRAGKGGSSRVIPLSKGVVNDLGAYMGSMERNKAAPQKPDDGHAFFITHQGRRMRGEVHYRCFKKLLTRAGLPEGFSLHHLRHSIATHLLASGMAVEQVQDFLGHKHLESTQVYTHINDGEL